MGLSSSLNVIGYCKFGVRFVWLFDDDPRSAQQIPRLAAEFANDPSSPLNWDDFLAIADAVERTKTMPRLSEDELKQRCCAIAADTKHEAAADEAFVLARAWLDENPINTGCSVRDLKQHRRKCSRAVIAAQRQKSGFAISLSLVTLIFNLIATLFELWFGDERAQQAAGV